MYRQQPFAVDDAAWCTTFAAAHGFPTVVVTGPDGPVIGHGACVVDPDGAWVDVHLAKVNPVVKVADDAEAEFVFLGDHTYVSPTWYADPTRNVPTWDYEAVHATGRLTALDEDGTLEHLDQLSAFHEGEGGWSVEKSREHVLRVRPGMAAFRLHVDRWEGQRKLSQNRSDQDRAAVGRALSTRRRDSDRRLGQAVLDELAAHAEPATPSSSGARGDSSTEPISLADFELRLPTADDRDQLVEASRRSAELWTGWGGPPMDEEGFDAWLDKVDPELNHRNLAFHRGELLGLVSLQNIVRGHGQYTTLGYSGFLPLAGRGLMRRAVALGVDLALRPEDEGGLGLHRVEAGIQPTNTRSIRLIESLGFRYEGLLRRLVQIDGEYRDHELWATDTEDWPGAAAIFGDDRAAAIFGE